MSVPVPKRDSGELEVNTMARSLTVYTFQILANPKWFPQSQARRGAARKRRCVVRDVD